MYLHAWKLEMALADTEKEKEKENENEKERDFEQKGELARGNKATDCTPANSPPLTMRCIATDYMCPDTAIYVGDSYEFSYYICPDTTI